MYSYKSEYNERRQYGDRSSRQWDDRDDRWEERRESHRDGPQDSYHKYGGDGHSSTKRTSRSREYSDSPKRVYNKDLLSRDRSRKSTVGRRVSSPDWGASEKKMRRLTEDDENGYRYRNECENKTYMQPPDSFSHSYTPKDLKDTPQDEDFRYRKTPQDFRHRHRHEEFTYRQQCDDFRHMSGCHKDRDHDERSWDHSQERSQSQDRSTKSYSKARERNESPSTDHKDLHQNRSFKNDVTNQSTTVPGQKLTTGFQRFLDVLNKGVNVTTLTKIVTQTSAEASPACSPTFADQMWAPTSVRQQGSHQENYQWGKSEGSQRLSPPQCHPRSFRSEGCSLSDEKSLQRSDGGQSCLRLRSRSTSPSVVDKITLTPEEEHRQMQGVLQAIGMDLGFEELGQMSHRIQERLYGKKVSDLGHRRRGSGEQDKEGVFSPRHRSRSSSSRSNISPLTQAYDVKKDSYSAQIDVPEMYQTAEYCQNRSSSSVQDGMTCETNSLESTAELQAFSQNPTYSLLEPPPTPAVLTYSPFQPYPAQPPVLLPPLSHVVPRFFLPRRPPLLPTPHMQPMNIFPALLSQTRHLLPQCIGNPQSPFFNLPGINPVQPVSTTQKSKTVSRPRCLQVIETKQAG